MAMHQRYEATMIEYLAIEVAESDAIARNDDERFAFERASSASCRETDALRTAILHQVPATIAEAAVLQFHNYAAFDVVNGMEDAPEFEREALKTAISTMLDFLCREMKGDHAAIGEAFKDAAVQVFFARRRRTGEMGE
jgi:hypothetical protein